MSEGTELKSYSSFATRYELKEVKDQLRLMQQRFEALHDKDQARDGPVLQHEGSSSNGQDNRGFAVHNEGNARECHEIKISLG